jgi:hypothetical protein
MTAKAAYRYRLDRRWSGGTGLCGFIMLNPSTADARSDDPTIRRCIGFAKAWGYSGLIVGNLFALRATDPAVLLAARDPVGGRANARALFDLVDEAALVLCAWGQFSAVGNRGREAIALVRGRGRIPHCLGLTKHGAPRHPLYLPASTRPVAMGSGNLAPSIVLMADGGGCSLDRLDASTTPSVECQAPRGPWSA